MFFGAFSVFEVLFLHFTVRIHVSYYLFVLVEWSELIRAHNLLPYNFASSSLLERRADSLCWVQFPALEVGSGGPPAPWKKPSINSRKGVSR